MYVYTFPYLTLDFIALYIYSIIYLNTFIVYINVIKIHTHTHTHIRTHTYAHTQTHTHTHTYTHTQTHTHTHKNIYIYKQALCEFTFM